MYKIFSLAIVLCGLVFSQAQAGFQFTVESAVFLSDGINPTAGSVNVRLTSTNPAVDFPGGIGPNIQSYVANLQVTGLSGISSVTLLPATIANTPLFPSTPSTTLPPTNPPGQISVTNAFADFGLNPASFNNAGLFKLNFTTPVGQTGSFQFSFLDTPAFPTDLNNVSGSDILAGANAGTITIAVPEPSSLALLGVVGLACGWRRARKPVLAHVA